MVNNEIRLKFVNAFMVHLNLDVSEFELENEESIEKLEFVYCLGFYNEEMSYTMCNNRVLEVESHNMPRTLMKISIEFKEDKECLVTLSFNQMFELLRSDRASKRILDTLIKMSGLRDFARVEKSLGWAVLITYNKSCVLDPFETIQGGNAFEAQIMNSITSRSRILRQIVVSMSWLRGKA